MISIWEEGLEERQPNILKKDRSCQVLIIGASLTGFFTALLCKQKGLDAIIIEENTIDERALEIDFFEQIRDLRTWSYSIWQAYICIKRQIPCELTRMSSYYYWLAPKPTAKMPKQTVFHPIKWMRYLADELEVYEHIHIRELLEHRLVTESEYIDFKHVIDVRKTASKEEEKWIAVTNVSIDPGFYLCMDGDVHYMTWKGKLIMRESYEFLFPYSIRQNEWKIDPSKKEGIYQSIADAKKYMKKLNNTQIYP